MPAIRAGADATPATKLWLGGQYGEEGNKGEDRREEEGACQAQGRG